MLEHADLHLRKGAGRSLVQLLYERLPLILALGLCVGAAFYMEAGFEPSLWALIGGFLASLFGFAVYRTGVFGPSLWVGIALTLGVGMASGALAGKLASLRVSHPVIANPIGPVMLEGWVEDVEPAKRGVRLRLQVHAIDGFAKSDLPEMVRVTHITRLEVEAGRFVRCWAVLRPPPAPIIRGDYAFHRQAYYEGLGAVGYVQGRCRGGTLGLPANRVDQFKLAVSKVRRRLAHFVNQAAGPVSGGFAAAVASGDRSFIRAEDQEALRGSGLAHLLAISGLHMGIVGGLIYLMVWRSLALIEPIALRITVRKPAALAALSGSFVYLLLSGASVSTQRAYIMAMVFFGAVLFDRAALSLRSLAIAMIIVVMVSPWTVLTPGFQMSFAATGALIAAYEAWQRRRRASTGTVQRGVTFWASSLFVTSLVSGLATAPFALYHFDRVSGWGLLANLAAMPIVSLVSAPLAGLTLLAAPFGFAEPVLRAFGYSLEAVLWVAREVTAISPIVSGLAKPMPGAALAMLSLGLVLAIVLRGWLWRASTGLVCLVAASLLWWGQPARAIHWAPSGDVYLVDQAGHVTRYQVAKGEGLEPLRYIDVPLSKDCRQQICTATLEGLDVRLIPAGAPDICLPEVQETARLLVSAPGADDPCQTQLNASWPEIVSAGGMSWSLTDLNTATAIRRTPCGVRPWYPCSAAPEVEALP